MDQILAPHGAPRTLLSDRGFNFLSKLVLEVCKLIETRKVNTTAYHPQTDGLVEKFNGTLAQTLSMYTSANQKDWDLYIPTALFAYRVSPHPSTGDSPFYLLYGREPRLPIDVSLLPPKGLSPSVLEHRARIVRNISEGQIVAQDNVVKAQQAMKHYHDLRAKEPSFLEGDRVWVFSPAVPKGLTKKLLHRWHGPYRISKQLSLVHYQLSTCDNRRLTTKVHANRLKLYYDRADRPIDEPVLDITDPLLPIEDFPTDSLANDQSASTVGPPILPPTAQPQKATPVPDSTQSVTVEPTPPLPSDVFSAERLIAVRARGGQRQYLVKWAGYPASCNTWEPEGNILDHALIDNFEKRKNIKRTPRVSTFSPISTSSFSPVLRLPFWMAFLLFSLYVSFTASTSPPTTPSLGPLYDCTRTQEIGLFHLNQKPACRHNMHDSVRPINHLHAVVSKPLIRRTAIRLKLCTAYVATFFCKERFFGSKSWHKDNRPMCIKAVNDGLTPFGPLQRVSTNRWQTRISDHYVCHWMKSDTVRYSHFIVTEYSGLLIGDDIFIHQDLTKTTCIYKKFSCIPKEMPHMALIWKRTKHNPSKFLKLGNYALQKLDDFVLVPKLGIGGAIQSSSNDGKLIQLDNGFLCSLRPNPASPYATFRKTAANYLKLAKPTLETSLLESHITVALEIQRDSMIQAWEQLCNQQHQVDLMKHWLLRHFPETSAQWIYPDYGYRVDVEGDGLILAKCKPVYQCLPMITPRYLV